MRYHLAMLGLPFDFFQATQIPGIIESNIQTKMMAKDFAGAVSMCTAAEEAYPKLASSLQPIHFESLALAKDDTKAAAYLKANGASNPTLYMIATNMALQSGKTPADFQKALTYAKAYGAAKGTDPYQAKYMLSQVYQKLGKNQKAIQALQDGIALAKNDKSGEGAQVIPAFKQMIAQLQSSNVAKAKTGSGKN